MKFLSDVRLLLLSIWLGSAVFFIAVAQSAFAVIPQRDMAGAVVSRTLAILNFGGLAISVILLLTSFVGTKTIHRASVWTERFMFVTIAAACAIGQFVIGLWLAMVRGKLQEGQTIDGLAPDDPLRVQFNNLHNWSEWVLIIGMIAALIAFFLLARRTFGGAAKSSSAEPYNFEKEFKI